MNDIELRERVAVEVMGWVRDGDGSFRDDPNGGWAPDAMRLPDFEDDIAAAWQVVDAMRERGWSVVLNSAGHTAWTIQVAGDFPKPDTQFADDGYMSINAPTAPLAICRAAVIVMEALK